MSSKAGVIAISNGNLFVPNKLGELNVTYNGRDFSVIDSKGLHSEVKRADLSKDLRGVTSDCLQKMLEVGYLSINTVGEDYTLQ